MSDVLDVRALMRLLLLARVELAAHESALNAMNVFPIPDGDTGTNMRATMDAGLRASSQMTAHDEVSTQHVVRAIARSAQGNSGVILAEYVQGFLSEMRRGADAELALDADALARGLNEAARRTRKAVAEPVEGTVISVADAAAAGAVQARRAVREGLEPKRRSEETLNPGASSPLAHIATGALEAASRALEHSPQQLDALRTAGVVDAGGAGLVILLDALVRVCVGAPLLAASGRSLVRRLARSPLRNADGCQVRLEGPAYEVMAVIEGLEQTQADDVRVALNEVGESVVVAGSAGFYRIHVHTDAVVQTLSAVREFGSVNDVSVVRFAGARPLPAAIATPDQGIYEYARALGLEARMGETAVVVKGEPVSRTGVELLEFLEGIEFRISQDAPIDIHSSEISWLIASWQSSASAQAALDSFMGDQPVNDAMAVVLLHPDLPHEERQAIRTMVACYPEVATLNVDSGHAVQIGVSHG